MDKIEQSIQLLKQYEPKEGYHLAFSGGKDSICILQLAKMAGVKYRAYFYLTTLDPPEILWFIRTFYPEVQILRPKTSMFKLIEKKGLPIRQKRFCCEKLKEIHGSGETVLDGVRASESVKRSKREKTERHWKDQSKFFVHAIFNWTSKDVWSFIHEHKLPFPEVYLSCQNRVGCIACPMAPNRAKKDLIKYPRYKHAFLKAIKKAMAAGKMITFESPEEALDWWVSGKSVIQYRELKKQTSLQL